jgi:hypothetical protein
VRSLGKEQEQRQEQKQGIELASHRDCGRLESKESKSWFSTVRVVREGRKEGGVCSSKDCVRCSERRLIAARGSFEANGKHKTRKIAIFAETTQETKGLASFGLTSHKA